ncbi:MAG TPA: ATP-binding protein, partial [Labilithrix sp.]|nr:ATP-binding protein [Labilithrix sp.]
MRSRGEIVGRAGEIGEIERGLDNAKAGQGRLYVIAGEGGIGKSRLATEIARLALDRGFIVAWGRCAEVGGAPAFWPWIQVLRAIRRTRARGSSQDGDGSASFERLLPRLRGGDAERAAVDPTQARLALFEDVVEALREVAEHAAPLAILFEDLHAADPSSLALVHFLARELVDAPILVLVTYRDQEIRRHADRGEGVQRIAREAVYLP